ncbi:MAG TPA: hypothetical protein VF142_19445 [Longimicrobium sp.]
MSDVLQTTSVVTEKVTITEGGEVVLETAAQYPDYRTYTMPHPTEPRDRIHYLSSYNLRYDPQAATWTKDVADKAGFHLALESEWADTIEFNLDHTLRNDANIRRIMGMMCHVDTGRTAWSWATDLVRDAGLRLGGAQPTVAEWGGSSGDAAMGVVVQNRNTAGGAYVGVHNSGGLVGQMQATAFQNPNTLGGLTLGNSFLVLGMAARMVVGTESSAPLHFMTAQEHRGGIRGDGTWYQVRDGQEHVMPHDPVPWSSLFPPMRTGCVYQSQFISQRGKDALAANTATAAPFVVPRATAFDQLALEVTTSAAGATVRLGVYADDGDGRPGALVLDAGTVDASSIGLKTRAAAFTLQPGLYWLVAAARGGSPTTRTGDGGGGWMVPQPLTGAEVHNGYTGGHPTDALASTFAYTGTTASAPLVLLRAA